MPSKSLNERAEYDRGYVEGYRMGQKDFAEKVKAEILALNDDYCSTQEVLDIIENIGKGDKK